MQIKKKHTHASDEHRTRPVAVKFYLTDDEASIKLIDSLANPPAKPCLQKSTTMSGIRSLPVAQ